MFITRKELEKRLDTSWQSGFETGRKKVVPEIKKVYIRLLTEEINDEINKKQPGAWLKGLDRAIEIIRKGKR